MRLKIWLIFIFAQLDGYLTYKGLVEKVYQDELNILLRNVFYEIGLLEGIIARAIFLFLMVIILNMIINRYDVDSKLIRFMINIVLIMYIGVNFAHYIYLR